VPAKRSAARRERLQRSIVTHTAASGSTEIANAELRQRDRPFRIYFNYLQREACRVRSKGNLFRRYKVSNADTRLFNDTFAAGYEKIIPTRIPILWSLSCQNDGSPDAILAIFTDCRALTDS